jgi:hypothetical protein
MKKSNLSSLITLSLSLEMILAPLPALANDNQNKSKITGQQVMEGLNYGMGLYNQVRGGAPNGASGGQMPPQMATDMSELQKQQTPLMDKFFTLQNMQKIPGLMEYISVYNAQQVKSGGKTINPAQLDCKTLPTTLYIANNEVCRNGVINPLTGDPVFQRDEAKAYYNQYFQIENLYKNYTQDSNVGGQSFGTGCMNDAMQLLKGFFDYRTSQIDAVMGEMEKALTAFEEQSKGELTNIKKSTAVLNGEGSQFANEFKNTDAFNYSARFADPACSSIFPKDGAAGVSQLGKNGGLLSIEEKLNNDFSNVPEGSNYSPEQFISKNAEIVADITKMADKVSEQAQLNFNQISSGQSGYSSFLDNIGKDVPSETGANQALNKSFFSDLQTKFTKVRNQLTDEATLISSELGQSSKNAMDLVNKVDNDSSFEAEVTTLENSIKADCVNQSGIDTALSRVYDPRLSKQANKQTAEQMRKKIRAILSETNLSQEKKMERLKALDNQNSNRFEMKLDANYETQEVTADGKIIKKTVSAAGRVTPGTYFTDVMKNCESQFQVNKLNNKLSGKDAIKKLRTLKQDYKKAARQHAQDIRGEIIKKMIDCGGNGAKAASAGVGTCGPDKLNMTSPGFCTKAALSCSSNMKTCTDKAKKFVKELKDERLKLSNNYNANVELHRKQLVASFDTALKKYTTEAEALRAQFGIGFTVPTGINRDITDGTQFNTDFQKDEGDKLEIKDPKKYLDMVKVNMLALKTQVKDQQDQIVGDSGLLAKHIQDTKSNYQTNVIGPAKSYADKCMAAYDSYAQIMSQQKSDYDKTQGEMGEKNGELCSKYDQIMSNNPNGACDTFEQTGNDALKAAAMAGGNTAAINSTITEMRARCAGSELDDAWDICETELATKGNLIEMCKALKDPTAKTEKGKHCDLKKGSDKYYNSCQIAGTDKTKYPKSEAMKKCGTDEEYVDHNISSSACTDTTQVNFEINCKSNDTYDCANLEKKIKSAYKSARTASFASSTQSNSVPATCPANNTSQFNAKSLFPDGTNPLTPSGANTSGQ